MSKPAHDNPKRFIFHELGITDTTPWDGMSIPEIMQNLRETASITRNDVSRELKISAWKALAMEASGKPEDVKMLLAVIKPPIAALVRQGWPARGLEDIQADTIKPLLFAAAGITDTGAWSDKSVPQIMAGLRESAAYTQEEVAAKLQVTRERVRQMEDSGRLVHAETLLGVLKPRLRALVKQRWLLPESLTPDEARMDAVAAAAKYLRKKDEKHRSTNCYGFSSDLFESRKVTFAHFIEDTRLLCEHFNVKGVDALLKKAALVRSLGYDRVSGSFAATHSDKKSGSSFRTR